MIVQHATREDWLRERLTGIGGSDAPAILGESSYSCALRVWADRVSPASDVDPPPAPGTPMDFGLRFERPIAEAICEMRGLTIEPVKHPTSFAASVVFEELPFLRSTPDFFVRDQGGRRGILQIKNVGIDHADKWARGRAPTEYEIQVQHELLTCQSEQEAPDFAILGACVGGNRPVMRDYALDWDFAAYWIERASEFWRCVETRTPPRDVFGPGARKAALGLRKRDASKAIALSGAEWESLAKERMEIAARIKDLEIRAEEIDARVVLALGDASQGIVDGVGWILISHVDETPIPAHVRKSYSKAQWYPSKKGKA